MNQTTTTTTPAPKFARCRCGACSTDVLLKAFPSGFAPGHSPNAQARRFMGGNSARVASGFRYKPFAGLAVKTA